MDRTTASRSELLQLIDEQQLTIARLEARIAELEARLGGGNPRGMPGHKPQQTVSVRPKRPRKRRPHGFGRVRATTVTTQVAHALDACPQCGYALRGGSVKRTREVLEVAPAPVQVIEHQYVERVCPQCGRRVVPRVDLSGVVAGHQRLGIELVSLIASLREVGRLPIQSIRWYLATVHGLRLSVGGIVGALDQVAQQGEQHLERVLAAIRASPHVHADETGWRQAGKNGYVWTFSTATERYFTYGRRTKEMVDEVLDARFSGVLVSDFYAAYHHYAGLKQRCWAHLLREIHELRVAEEASHPEVAVWAKAVHELYTEAKAFTSPKETERLAAVEQLQQRLVALCAPGVGAVAAPHRKLCARIARFIAELFVFVLHPGVPSENNAAERSLRHLVTTRKISGGTRSPKGTATKMALSSLFGTWTVRGLNPWLACQQMLASPQV